MINELEIEKYLNENFNIEYVNHPNFSIVKINNNKAHQRCYSVKAYLVEGLESFENLNKDGLEKIYVYRDPMSHILFSYHTPLHDDIITIRMHPIYKNKRYKLKLKKHV